MKFKYIKVKNIRTLREFELTFDDSVTIIQGRNTAGKTSMLYSCLYALFGLQGIPITKEELFTTGTSQSKVELTFEHDSNTYTVSRTKSSSVIVNQEGKDLANGHADVSAYIKEVLQCTDTKDYLIDATSVVDATSVSSIDENIAQVQNYSSVIDLLERVKTYAKTLKQEAMDIPLVEVMSEFDLSQMQVDANSYDNCHAVTKDLAPKISLLSDLLTTKDKYQSVLIDITKLGVMSTLRKEESSLTLRYESARAMLSADKAYSTYVATKRNIEQQLANLTDPSEAEDLPEQIEALKQELVIRRNIDLLDSLTQVDCDSINQRIVELTESINNAELSNKLVHQWDSYLELKAKTKGMTSVEVQDALSLHEALDSANEKLKNSVCPECGTVLSPETLDESQSFIEDNQYPELTVPQLKRIRVSVDRYEEETMQEPAQTELVDIKPLRRSLSSAEAELDTAINNNQDIERIAGYLLTVDIDGVRSSNELNKELVRKQDKLDSLTGSDGIKFNRLTKAINELQVVQPVQLSGNEDEVVEAYPLTYASLKTKIGTISRLQLEQETLRTKLDELTGNLNGSGFDEKYDYRADLLALQAKYSEAERYLDGHNRPNIEYAVTQRNNAIESNRVRGNLTVRAKRVQDLGKRMHQAVEQAKAKVWSTMLAQANAFVNAISGGTMFDIVKEGGLFYFMEQKPNDETPYRRSLRGGASGYQRTLVGLALRLAYRTLAGDKFPFLLDEVGGRLDQIHRTAFITQLTGLPHHQIVYVSHETTDVMLGEVKVIGE